MSSRSSGGDYTIIGVAERGFSGFDINRWKCGSRSRSYPAFRPGDRSGAACDLAALVARLARASAANGGSAGHGDQTPRRPGRGSRPGPACACYHGPLLAALGRNGVSQASIALWLVGAVGFVLLIACANVANLCSLAVRAAARVRGPPVPGRARGPSRSPVVDRELPAGVLVGALGPVLSVWLAGAADFFRCRPHGLVFPDLAFTAAPPLFDGTHGGGSSPGCSDTRGDLTSVANATGALESGRGQRRSRPRCWSSRPHCRSSCSRGLGCSFVRFATSRAIDVGSTRPHRYNGDPGLARGELRLGARATSYASRSSTGFRRCPGVRAASYEGLPPFQGVMGSPHQLPGARQSAERPTSLHDANFVGPDFLRAAGTPLLRGPRHLAETDRANTQQVLVVNETMAARLWPGRDPIGQCLQISTGPSHSGAPPTCHYVVGVMGNGKYESVTEDPVAYYVMPYHDLPMPLPPTLLIRATGDPSRSASGVRNAIAGFAPISRNLDVRLLSDAIDPQLQPYRIGAVLFTAFGRRRLAWPRSGCTAS